MHLQRLERAFSSGECSTSRPAVTSAPIRRLHSLPAPLLSSLPHTTSSHSLIPQAISRSESVVSTSAVLDTIEGQLVEPEAELLSEDRMPEGMSEYRDHVAALQNLERVKGKLRSSLFDLDYPDLEVSLLSRLAPAELGSLCGVLLVKSARVISKGSHEGGTGVIHAIQKWQSCLIMRSIHSNGRACQQSLMALGDPLMCLSPIAPIAKELPHFVGHGCRSLSIISLS